MFPVFADFLSTVKGESCLPGQADEAKVAGRAGTEGKGGPVQKGLRAPDTVLPPPSPHLPRPVRQRRQGRPVRMATGERQAGTGRVTS
jgi:hypothetical protein